MAETVVSMAKSMLGGAINMATSAAAAELSLVMGVQKDIWFIKDELKTMQAFLAAAEATKNKDMLLKVWAEQVRDLSYNIEDCLDEFMVHVRSQSLTNRLMKLKDRRRIAIQIRNLKSRVEEVSSRNTRYNLIKTEAPRMIDEEVSYIEDVRNHSASNIVEADLVGFKKPKEDLIKLMDINNKDGCAKVICVVGMGGLGKTTLARKAYESEEDIVKNFSCCAWITVSQSFSRIEMLKDMIRQLLGGESLKEFLRKLEGKVVQVEDLAEYLIQELKDKRYFIVLDDLWTIGAWGWIKDIILPSSNMKGSRIIVTTRDVGLAKECTHESLIYHLKPLESVDAKNLLLKKSRKIDEDMDKDENFKNIVEKLVKKCGCLPLAILTIGGILATKKIGEWEHIYNQLPSELESNPSLEAMKRMVTLSYTHLPSHLKSCFLYLSIFPEDSEIQMRRLVERWIAEGFVRAKTGVNIEDVGKDYFNELINRGMIQPSRVNIKGLVKSCRVHDIVRDVMVSISKDENFVYIEGDNFTSVAEETFRHVAQHGKKSQKIGMDWSHVRSLTVFGERPKEPSTSLCSPELRMLRTLDLDDAHFLITQKDINNIGLLRHLKYVKVRNAALGSAIYNLPEAIGKLQGLQSLDIRNSCITTLPTGISKLQGLRTLRCSNRGYYFFNPDDPKMCMISTLLMPMILTHLSMPISTSLFSKDETRSFITAELHIVWSSRWSMCGGVKVPRGISNLKELQILEAVDIGRTSSRAIEELGELVQLKKLAVATKGATKKKCKLLPTVIQKLSSLHTLRVDAIGGSSRAGTLEWLDSISSPPPVLRTLKLYGLFVKEMPNWVRNLTHLVKIYLCGNRMVEGGKSMEILRKLPNLMHLSLLLDSYIGEKLALKMGEFLNLKKLDIRGMMQRGMMQLREVKFEEGTSPHMEMIEIHWCTLASGIIGIKHLPRLKEISLGYGGKVAKLATLQSEVDAHPNSPVLRMVWNQSKHDLGNVIVTVEEATGESPSLHPEPAAADESSQSQAVDMATTSISQDPDIREVEGSALVEDDFWSCNSDDDDA